MGAWATLVEQVGYYSQSVVNNTHILLKDLNPEKHFRAALRLAKTNNDWLGEFNAHTAMGSWTQGRRELRAAERHFGNALSISVREDPLPQSTSSTSEQLQPGGKIVGLTWRERATAHTNLANVLSIKSSSEGREDEKSSEGAAALRHLEKAHDLHRDHNPAWGLHSACDLDLYRAGDNKCSTTDVDRLAIFLANYVSHKIQWSATTPEETSPAEAAKTKEMYQHAERLAIVSGNERVRGAVLVNMANHFQCSSSRKKIALNEQCFICLEGFDPQDREGGGDGGGSSAQQANGEADFCVLECHHCVHRECFNSMCREMDVFQCPLCRSKLGFTG